MTEWWEWREAPPADFAVLGDPISHSLSPAMHRAALRLMSRPERYVAVRVPEGEFEEAVIHLQGLGFVGLNVTVPLKAAAVKFFAGDEFSVRCGAANTIDLRTRRCINTDGQGFMDTLSDLPLERPSVLLLGAGGAARAVALSCALAGYPLKVFNRTRSRALSMIEELQISASVVDSPTATGIDLIVNATSATLNSEVLPIDWRAGSGVAYDLMYGSSSFLAQAASHGWRTVDGREMLVAQGARSLEFWLGLPVPRQVMREALL